MRKLLCASRRLLRLPLLLLLLTAVTVAASAWPDDVDSFFDDAEPLPLAHTAAAFPPFTYSTMGRSHAATAVYGERMLSAELPSLQQRHALATDSPALLLARTRGSESVLALDGLVARMGGTGRVGRPSGISITRGLPLAPLSTAPLDAHPHEQLPVNATAITFRDNVLQVGTVRACEPQLHFIEIINRADVDVRLYALEFTRTGFEVLTDVRGKRVRAFSRTTLDVLFTPSEPEPHFEAFMRVFTSSGLFALRITGIVVQHPLGVAGISAVVPVATAFTATLTLTNPFETSVRVYDVFARDPIGSFAIPGSASALAPPAQARAGGPRTDMWLVPPGAERRIVDYTVQSQHAGVFTTYIRMTTSSDLAVAIPVVVEVVPEGLYVEPARVDLGVLTATVDALREVHVDLFNAASVPIQLLGVDVVESNMDVSVTLNGPVVVHPKTRIRQALTVELQAKDMDGGDSECYATLEVRTNVSSSGLVIGDLKLRGTQLDGTISYDFPRTLVGVRLSTADLVHDNSETNETTNEDDGSDANNNDDFRKRSSRARGTSQLDELLLTPEVFAKAESVSVELGTTVVRSLRLKNLFSIPLELEDVWVSSDSDGVVAVDHFARGFAPSGEYWPGEIRLRITMPLLTRHDDSALLSRVYIVHVDTNMVHFQLPVHVFYGFLRVTAASDVTNSLAVTGYLPAMKSTNQSVLPTRCFSAAHDDDDKLATGDTGIASDEEDESAGADDGFIKLCRSVVMDLGKVSQRRARTEVLTLSNINAIPVHLRIAQSLSNNAFDFRVTSVLSEGSEVAAEVAAVGRAWANPRERAPTIDLLVSHQETHEASNASGDPSVAISPGHDLALTLGLELGEYIGEGSAYLLTLETEFEFLHVFARFESVEGTIAPVVPEIITAPLFAGTAAYVDVLFTNTFRHDVQVSALSFPGASVQVVTATKFLQAQATHVAFSLLFSPGYHDDCRASQYLADCLLPRLQVHALANPLSNYGELVSFNDLIQFERRQAAWRAIERTGGGETPEIEAVVQLHTAIMDPTPVRIVAPLARPSVTAANLSEALAVCRFPLVKVMERSHATVRVRNPSSITVDMELAIGFHERTLFYQCNESVVSEPACLVQWEAAVVKGAQHANESVPPFFLASRVVRVLWGEEAELGPVYFFPSLVRTYDTMLYVRNELTHIEPVHLVARSGTGSLEVRVQTEAETLDHARMKLSQKPRGDLSGDHNATGDSRNGTVVVQFDASSAAPNAPFASRERAISLTNVGDFELAIERVGLLQEASPFSVRIETQRDGQPADRTRSGGSTPLVLLPGGTTTARVRYEPNCLVSKVEETLEIVAENVTTRVQLVAELHQAMAFACLRTKAPRAAVALARGLWMVSVCIALLASLSSGLLCARNVLLLYRRELLIRSPAAFATTASTPARLSGTTYATTDALDVENVVEETQGTVLCRQLNEFEASAYVADARVETPAVARLLAERAKRSLVASKPPSQQQRPSDTEPMNGGNKTPPTPKATRNHPESMTSEAVPSATLRASSKRENIPLRTTAASSSISAPAASAKVKNDDTAESTTDAVAHTVVMMSGVQSSSQRPKSASEPALGPRKAEVTASGVSAFPSPRALPTTAALSKPGRPTPPARVATPSLDSATLSSRVATPSPRTGTRSPEGTLPPETKAGSKCRRQDDGQARVSSAALVVSLERPGVRPNVKPTTPGSKLQVESGAASPVQRTLPDKKMKKRATASSSPRIRRPVAATEAVSATYSETKAAEASSSKKLVRPSSGKGEVRNASHQVRVDEREPIRVELSKSPSDSGSMMNTHESADTLASSMDSTSTAMSFESMEVDDLRQLLSTATRSAVGTGESLFLSTTFEAPFGSFGAIGKPRSGGSLPPPPPPLHQSPQFRAFDFFSDSHDGDAVIVEPFVGTMNTERLGDIDDDWSDLYFDSIRSEIGRLVSGDNTTRSSSPEPRAATFDLSCGLQALTPTAAATVAVAAPVAVARSAPPGFTPADANPRESIAAFERLRSSSGEASATRTLANGVRAGETGVFASRLSLFGPTLTRSRSPTAAHHTELQATAAVSVTVPHNTGVPTVGNDVAFGATPIGGSGEWSPSMSSLTPGSGSELATLGGVELVTPFFMAARE